MTSDGTAKRDSRDRQCGNSKLDKNMTTTKSLAFGLEYAIGDTEARAVLKLVSWAFDYTADSFRADVAARDARILLKGPFPECTVEVEGSRIVIMRWAERLFTVAQCKVTAIR